MLSSLFDVIKTKNEGVTLLVLQLLHNSELPKLAQTPKRVFRVFGGIVRSGSGGSRGRGAVNLVG